MVDRPQDEEPEVKVTDRRQFTPEGERIPTAGGEEKSGDDPPPGKVAEDTAAPEGADAAEGPEFGTLVMGLANTALIHLGELKDPSRPAAEPNLPAAREVIDLLALLQEKTKGNLTPDEQHLLETLLFKLRMDFSEKAGAR